MKILDKKIKDIVDNKQLNSKFIFTTKKSLDINCNILVNDFYLDSHNYFPLTNELYTFYEFFVWGDNVKYQNFYTKNFVENFKKNYKNFKTFSNIFVLGSSSNDNYYRNIVTFLPRIFFNKEKNIKLCLHRNSSNKFRNFIKILANKMNINVQFIYLDDGFYKFQNSTMPQFFKKKDSFKILNTLKNKNLRNEKIYISRQNCSYRNIINESDIIEKLKKLNFRIVDLNDFDIFQQIELFSNASVIITATGSALANLVFCNPGTKIFEISPKYKYEYENNFKTRYSYIADILNLKWKKINADPVNIKSIDKKSKLIINAKIIKESNYYKDLILNIDEFINNISF